MQQRQHGRFFQKLGPQIYRAGKRPILDADDARTCLEECDDLLATHDTLVFLIDTPLLPPYAIGDVLRRWYRSRRSLLSAKVLCAIHIIPDQQGRTERIARHALIAARLPFPEYFVGTIHHARRVAEEEIARSDHRTAK